MKSFFLFIFLISSAQVFGESFASRINSGKVKLNKPSNYKQPQKDFAKNIYKGNIKRDYSTKKNYRKRPQNFAKDIHKKMGNGKKKANIPSTPLTNKAQAEYKKPRQVQRPLRESPASTNDEIKRGKSIRKGFWSRKKSDSKE